MTLKKQVLLCGTQYGQTYLPAIYASENLELTAVFARGSKHSIRIAEQAGVNFYTDANKIEEQIDLACVAIGGKASFEITKKLLSKKIDVLIEHPLSNNEYKSLYEIADKNNVKLHINSHFSYLPPALEFIKKCNKLNSNSRALAINAYCNSRTLYSLLDMLMQTFGSFNLDKLNINTTLKTNGYSIFSFSLNGILCNITYQRWRGEIDDSNDSPLGHQITVIFATGSLTFNNTYGPCIWNNLISSKSNSQQQVYKIENTHAISKQQIMQWRINANLNSINNLINGNISHQKECYLTTLTQLWSKLFKALGKPITFKASRT